MQDNAKTMGLTPRESYEAERKADIERRTRLEIEEERDDARMSSTMDKLGIDTRPDGKRSNKSVIRHNHKHALPESITNCLAKAGLIAASVKGMFDSVTSLAYMAGTSFAQTQNNPKAGILAAQDDLYIYDTIAVSAPTSEILNKEVKLITELQEELEAEQNALAKARLQMEFDDTIAYFDMRPHPVTKLYVHDYNHILVVESLNNSANNFERIGTVLYYLPKADIASSRGIKRGISDVYNLNPAEVELTQAEASAQMAAQPLAPAPRVS